MANTPPKSHSTPATRPSRTDGAATRSHLLVIAGQVFAERGLAGATSKEICERAGTPMASVNYHFGSREKLYETVLIEAHHQMIALDELEAIATLLPDARSKLRAVFSHLAAIANQSEVPWGFRVMLHEVMQPSAAIPLLVEKAIRPKVALMVALVAEVVGLPVGHPAVLRGTMFSVLPCIAMMLAPRQITGKLLHEAVRDPLPLAADFSDFALAGLDAIAAAHRHKA